MLHAELQNRLFILISVRWHEMRYLFPNLHRMIDPEIMAACATSDLENESAFQNDLLRARQTNQPMEVMSKLLDRHFSKWLVRLVETTRKAQIDQKNLEM